MLEHRKQRKIPRTQFVYFESFFIYLFIFKKESKTPFYVFKHTIPLFHSKINTVHYKPFMPRTINRILTFTHFILSTLRERKSKIKQIKRLDVKFHLNIATFAMRKINYDLKSEIKN